MTRPFVLGLAVACMAASFPAASQEPAFPARTVRLITSGVLGGLTDNTARVVIERMIVSPEMNGQAVIAENKPGAGGTVATLFTAKAPADGYTLMIADVGQTAIIPALFEKPQYDTLRDFVPVSLIGVMPLFLAVHASVPASTLQELIAHAKANPGKLSYGSSGTGSIHHLATETLKTRAGIDMLHVPYKGSGQSTPALGSGQIQVLFTLLSSMDPFTKSNRARLLAVASAERSPQAPDVPTFAERGVKDMVFVPSVAALAPAGTPAAVVAKLSAEIRKAVQHPDARKRFQALGIDPVGSTPEQYAAFLRGEIATFTQAVKASGAKPE